MENVKLINKRLVDTYGKAVTGQQFYRLSWSEDQFEVRKGDYHNYSPAGLYLGTEYNVVKKVRKYEYFKDKYVLEVFAPELQAMAKAANGELVDSDGYEPLFVFKNNKGEYLKPVWWALQFIIKRHREVIAHVEHRTEEMDRRDDQKALEAETLVFQDYLEQESSDLMNKFRYKEAVLIHKGN